MLNVSPKKKKKMFVRAKTVKGKKYAYLVENYWKKSKVKQKVKKYLGLIIPVERTLIIDESPIDFSQRKKEVIRDIISKEFLACGFERKRNKLVKDDIIIDMVNYKIFKGDKPAVISINNRYLYPSLLRYIVDFYEPEFEDDRPGQKLASAFSDAGIPVSKEDFISLYRLIY